MRLQTRLLIYFVIVVVCSVAIYLLGVNVLTSTIQEYSSLDLQYSRLLRFYSGVVDAISNLVYKTYVCRTYNVLSALEYAKFNNISEIFLLLDEKHLRTFVIVNNSVIFFDVTSPDYKFTKDSIIISCKLHLDKYVTTDCSVIYAYGDFSMKHKPVIDLIFS